MLLNILIVDYNHYWKKFHKNLKSDNSHKFKNEPHLKALYELQDFAQASSLNKF